MNPLAQNISPGQTENQGESSASPAANPSVQSATQSARLDNQENPEQSDQPQQGLSSQPTNPSGNQPASPQISPPTDPSLKIPPILLEGDNPSAPIPEEPDPKFALGVSPRAIAPEARGLPQAYGTNRLWLAARDPHSLYARWDLTAEQQQNYTAVAVSGRLALRVHLDTVRQRGLLEVQLQRGSRHCFIPVAFAGRCYLAELGYYQDDQLWHSVAVSEPVSTPHQGIAQDKTAVFATIPSRGLFPPTISTIPSSPQSLPATFKLSPALLIPESPREASPEAAFPFHDIPEGLLELTSAPEWSLAQEHALAQIIDWSAAGLGAPSSAEIGQWLQLPLPLGPSAGISSYLPQGEISSPFGDFVAQATDFWFSVNAELIIYGATEPNARVTIGGRAIRLRPDGTFSFRFALPDGRYELPIEAFSAQGNFRKAELEFRRRSAYQGDLSAHPQDPGLKKPDAGNVR